MDLQGSRPYRLHQKTHSFGAVGLRGETKVQLEATISNAQKMIQDGFELLGLVGVLVFLFFLGFSFGFYKDIIGFL